MDLNRESDAAIIEHSYFDHLSIQIIIDPSLVMILLACLKILQAQLGGVGGRGGFSVTLVEILQLKELRQSFKWKTKGA